MASLGSPSERYGAEVTGRRSTSLGGWAASTSYRAAYPLHMIIPAVFIGVQPLLFYTGFSGAKLCGLTMVVNMPLILARHSLHMRADADAAQSLGAPLQVCYTLLKPAL